MNRVGFLVLASWLVLLAPTGPAAATDPCRADCQTDSRACLDSATGAFVDAKQDCASQPTPAEKRTCIKKARAARVRATKRCVAAKRRCLADCRRTGGACKGSREADWVATVNLYRTLAGLPPVTERSEWSAGDVLHSTYVVKTNQVGHDEDTSSPHYTADGAAAGQNGNVAGHSDPAKGFGWAIDTWMTGPFHALGIIDPRLVESGFGIAHDNAGFVRTGATLDVIRGRTGSVTGITFPVVYPVDGGVLPLGRFEGNELPDPLASCPGYEAPTGPPLIVQLGSNLSVAPTVSGSTLTRDGAALEHCLFDGNTYTNTDAASQASVRSSLGIRGAVVILPRAPFRRGTQYTASITADGQPVTWTFTHDCP